MSITDELREYALGWDEGNRVRGDLTAIADRIDSEMVELPKDADGVPIHVGDTVWGGDGRAWHVEDISLGRWTKWAEGHVVHAMGDSGQWRDLMPEWLTHARPDSWKRIAQELEDTSEHFRATDKESFSALLDLADRIRRLASREDER